MSEEQTTPPPPDADEIGPAAVISAQSALRLLLVLLTMWTVLSGLALIFFQGGSGATIGGGLGGDEGEAAQRLLGVHLLVLAPIYGLLAWEPRRYRLLLWIPYAAQGGVVAATTFDILTGKRDFIDGALPLIVASVFFVLLVYVWRAGRRPEVAEAEEAELEVRMVLTTLELNLRRAQRSGATDGTVFYVRENRF
ncbi:MAG: hypothetical protein IH820_16405, partial [Bacteroidetes bacterium]|nr:hypothetical protein [Bacteroidota bacterium]